MENSDSDLDDILEESLKEVLGSDRRVSKYVHDGSLLTTNEYTAYLVFAVFMLNFYK